MGTELDWKTNNPMWKSLLDEIDDGEPLCPLCGEKLDNTELSFFPCPCKYQVCRFCLHKLKQTDARCPACRKPYDDKDARVIEDFQPTNNESSSRNRREGLSRTSSREALRDRDRSDLSHLSHVRVLQRNLVYLVNLPTYIARESALRQHALLGQYAVHGKISKIVINSGNTSQDSACAYVTFARKEDAKQAILAVNETYFGGKLIQASFGTTKYCSNFLQHRTCSNPECMYLHELGEEVSTFSKHTGPGKRLSSSLINPPLPPNRTTFAETPKQTKCFPPVHAGRRSEPQTPNGGSTPAPWAAAVRKPATPVADRAMFPPLDSTQGKGRRSAEPAPDLPPGFTAPAAPPAPQPLDLLRKAMAGAGTTDVYWAVPAGPRRAVTAERLMQAVLGPRTAPAPVVVTGSGVGNPERLALPAAYDVQHVLRLSSRRAFCDSAGSLFSRAPTNHPAHT
ncbi:RNA recognition motif in Eukaryotic CCR4-NOT transcription complex subunit 4 [Carpediemonas membranifera]|uniref:RNA recognition motif in Eukaryotic CCR4-NOT transcription complex subunit 4 n=1 Tax=Carpediemonas membranifera TaxID=201153 RepID=A0A8J6E1S2_9EUKA|nr:RNA recognition motif in Eukaryotic CCR4-NOT transcription complex subunit 4 [Carpediemonas membranifera]|eukprot:KAG9390997.1 RNA recognition motif in Eukaryotic CCR4-NOT transcription complex subunit 4 [Carpediemonas membranifera]